MRVRHTHFHVRTSRESNDLSEDKLELIDWSDDVYWNMY